MVFSQRHPTSLSFTHSFLHFLHSLLYIRYSTFATLHSFLGSHSSPLSHKMVAMQLTSLLLSAGALVSAAPASLDARASCTFTDAATAIKNKASCTAIVIKDMTVPA